MSNSASWRDLESRFRKLQSEQPGDGLRAEWDGIGRRWHLRGAPNSSVLRRFKQAAEYAVCHLEIESGAKTRRDGTQAHNHWLNLLRKEGDAFRVEAEGVERIEGKSAKTIASAKRVAALFGRRPGTAHEVFGTVKRVCEASADYCEHLADLAKLAEAEQESRPAAAQPPAEEPGPPVEKPEGFLHSDDYTSVIIRRQTFALTSRQAQMTKILHEAHKSGMPDVRIDYILVQLGPEHRAESSRWQNTWRTNPKARKELIKSGQRGQRKGTLRLNL